MNIKLKTLIPQLEELLSKETYSGFYIGKTDDCNSRSCDHENEGFAFFWEFAKGDCITINEGEIDLINYFKKESSLKSKCLNEKGGGAGNPNATYLYVTIKINGIKQIHELNDDSLNPFEPIIEL